MKNILQTEELQRMLEETAPDLGHLHVSNHFDWVFEHLALLIGEKMMRDHLGGFVHVFLADVDHCVAYDVSRTDI